MDGHRLGLLADMVTAVEGWDLRRQVGVTSLILKVLKTTNLVWRVDNFRLFLKMLL